MLHTAKLKVNLTYKGKRGKYVFTDKGLKVLRLFENK